MAGKYSKDELKEMLQRATFEIVATTGIEHVTVRKVANGCKLTPPYIYQCYADIPELLTDAYVKIDKQIAGLTDSALKLHAPKQDKWENIERFAFLLWGLYWDFLMADRNRTIFYWRFYQSGYYNENIRKERQKYYKPLINFFENARKVLGAPNQIRPQAAISTVIDDTASIAVKIHLGYLDQNAFSPEEIYQSVHFLLFRLIGADTLNLPDGGSKKK